MNRNLKSLLNGNSQALRNGDHDDSSDADLNQVAGNRGCRSDPVAIDKALGDIVADHLDDTGNSDSQRIPAVAVMFLGDSAYGEAHEADDDEGERSPEIPAGQQVKETHSESASQGAGAAPEDNGSQEQRHISQMNQSAVGCDGQAKIDKCGKNIGERNQHCVDNEFPGGDAALLYCGCFCSLHR